MGSRHYGDLVSTHGLPSEISLGDTQAIHQAAKVLGQGSGVVRPLRLRLAVAPPSIGDDAEAVDEGWRKVVEDVRVVADAVDEDQDLDRNLGFR
jgi:hypothetical protein